MNVLSEAETAPPDLAPPGGSRQAPLVLVFTDDPDRGGVAQYNHCVLLALARAGYRVACAQPRSDGPLVAIQRNAGVEHHWLPYETAGKNFARTLTDMATPKAIFEKTRPDLIVFSDCSPVSNLAARHAAMALRIPFVIVIGFAAEYLVQSSGSYLPLIARHFAAAREVVAVSEENLRLLRARFGLAADRGRVIHYGRPPEFFTPPDPGVRLRLRAELGIPADAVVSLTAARLTPIKGYRHQLAAIERLERNGSLERSHFVWLGDGEERAFLEGEIRRRCWEDRIHLPGHRWNMAEWLDLADIYVLPSESEGMPLSIMEAMAKGLPVVASAISGIPEELGETGRLIPDPKMKHSDAIEALARVLARWTSSPDERLQAGQICRDRAEEMFREETMLEKTLGLVGAALACRR